LLNLSAGAVHEVGASDGKYYSINVPLHDGIDNEGVCGR
jgi:acetoin utilization deacetylase AcuC-like enzyme